MQVPEIEKTMLTLAELAARETLPRFRTRLGVGNKMPDGFDPVTAADRAAERAMRGHIEKHYPEHGVIGEEEEATRPDADFCWIIDPIDGTRAYISGLPSWGTLIGLVKAGKPLAGLMHQPFTGEIYFSAGEGSYLLHRDARSRLATSETETLAEATLMTTSPFLFEGRSLDLYRQVEGRCLLTRYGFDCYAYAMLASGQIDVVVESDLKTFDIAALIPIIEQAGGIVTDWRGGPAIGGGDILACANPRIHAEAMDLLI